MKAISFKDCTPFNPGDRVVLPTGETGRLSSRPNSTGWIVIRDRDKQRFYYSEATLRECF